MKLFADASQKLGLPRSYGQIYGFAFVREHSVSFDDLVSVLGISKGSASQGLRWLRNAGLVKVARGPDDGKAVRHARREFYAPVTEPALIFEVVIGERLIKPLQTGRLRLNQLATLLVQSRAADGSRRGHLRRRLRELDEWHATAASMGPVLLRLAG